MFAFEPWSIKNDASHRSSKFQASSKLRESELDTMMHFSASRDATISQELE
jgi:hypothetical protein